MTAVFVHGVPESAAVWDPLLAELGLEDAVTLSPPGFGAPVPAGFDPTSDGYRDWLAAELERLADEHGGPVDLVGHDWGGGHAIRAATARPDLVRRLVTDIAGTGDPKYVWHELALVWQTEGAGEELVAIQSATTVEQRTEMLTDAGMTPAAARACAEAGGEHMGRCILALYRSAVQPRMTLWADQYRELGRDRPETLVIVAHDDHYAGGPDAARRTAQRWDAHVAELPGLGHWWMLQDPAAGANALRSFLNGTHV